MHVCVDLFLFFSRIATRTAVNFPLEVINVAVLLSVHFYFSRPIVIMACLCALWIMTVHLKQIADLHRESVDHITIPSKQGKGDLKRVEEVRERHK